MFGVRVVAAVTDNTSNMVGFREEVQKSKKLYCFGCQSHMFNLLAQHLSKEKPGLLEKVVHALKWFGNTHAAAAMLKFARISLPPLPSETRDTLGYYRENWAKLVEIAASQLRVGEAVRSHLEDIQTRRGCGDLFLQQDAVAHALNKSQ